MSTIKTAQVPKPRSRRSPVASAPAPGAAPAGHAGHAASFGNSPIKEMQKAIINFGNAAAATDVTSMTGNRDGKMEANPNPKPGQDKEYLGGSDPFGNFLVSEYLNSSDPVGHQYVNTDVSGKDNREGIGSNSNTSLRGVIDTIKRIGSPGSQGTEKAADGIWDNRTNNALKNVFAVAYAMFHLASDMNLEIPALTENSLDEFKSLVPGDYSKIQDKAGTATKLTGIITNMTKVFENFKSYVLTNKKYKAFIDQNQSFVKNKTPVPKNELNKDDQALLKDKSRFFQIPGVTVSGVKNPSAAIVSLNDLESMSNFKAMMQRMGLDSNNSQEVQKVYQDIMAKLSSAPATGPSGF